MTEKYRTAMCYPHPAYIGRLSSSQWHVPFKTLTLPRSKEVISSSHCLNYFIIAAALADVAIALIAANGINLSASRGKSHGGQAPAAEKWSKAGDEGQLQVQVSLFKF